MVTKEEIKIIETSIKDIQSFLKGLTECDELLLRTRVQGKKTNDLYYDLDLKLDDVFIDRIIVRKVRDALKEDIKNLKVLLKNKKSEAPIRADLMIIEEDEL